MHDVIIGGLMLLLIALAVFLRWSVRDDMRRVRNWHHEGTLVPPVP